MAEPGTGVIQSHNSPPPVRKSQLNFEKVAKKS